MQVIDRPHQLYEDDIACRYIDTVDRTLHLDLRRMSPLRTVKVQHPDRADAKQTTLNESALVYQLVWPYLSRADKGNVRQSCSDGRLAANAAVSCVLLTDAFLQPAQEPCSFSAFTEAQSVFIKANSAEQILHRLLISPNFAKVTTISLKSPSHIDQLTLSLTLASLPHLTSLSISAKPSTITPNLLAALPSLCPTLHTLRLSGCQALSSSSFHFLSRLTSLTTLQLSGARNLPFLPLAHLLHPLTTLYALELRDCTFLSDPSDPRLPSALHPLTSLHSAVFSRCSGVPLPLVFSTSCPPALRSLSLQSSILHTDPPFPSLPPTLTHLDLSSNPISSAPLPALPPYFSHLSLSCTNSPITPSHLPPTLTYLDLTQCHLSSSTFTSLTSLPHLTHLSFTSKPRTPLLTHLSTLTTLRTLHCPSLPLDRTLVPLLSALPHLHTLICHSILLWPNLPPLPSLSALTATHCHRFSDFDFMDVASVTGPALRTLALHNCSQLTPEAFPSLSQHLPSLTSLLLSGLQRTAPPQCARVAQHAALRSVALGLPLADPAQLASLTEQLQQLGLHALCRNALSVGWVLP